MGPVAPSIELDLAFQIAGDLGPALLAAAGDFGDSQAGEEAWSGLIVNWLQQLKGELPSALRAPTYCLGLSLVGDAEIAVLNRDWRQIEGPTDVLAFAAQEDCPVPLPAGLAGPGELELGDIVISLETAGRQAPEHGHSVLQELQFLASHGLLHLLGWDHPDEISLASMLARQDQLLNAPAPGKDQG